MSGNLALLLDTHVLVWISEGNAKLSSAMRARIDQEDLYVSAVVAFEYSDLLARGRFKTSATISALQHDLGLVMLDFPAALAMVAANLPAIHRDPVDRMLIAHALSADMPIVTADANIHRYPARIVW